MTLFGPDAPTDCSKTCVQWFQLADVIQENEDLRRQVGQHLNVIKRMESNQTGDGRTRESAELVQRLELLTQENDLLVSQQQHLEDEATRLNKQLQLQTADYLKLGQENMTLAAQLRAQEMRLAESEVLFQLEMDRNELQVGWSVWDLDRI